MAHKLQYSKLFSEEGHSRRSPKAERLCESLSDNDSPGRAQEKPTLVGRRPSTLLDPSVTKRLHDNVRRHSPSKGSDYIASTSYVGQISGGVSPELTARTMTIGPLENGFAMDEELHTHLREYVG